MGIQGLLQSLKYETHQGHIRDYAGQSVAVDASSWLHKAVYSIADYYCEITETTNAVDAKCIAAATKYMTTRCQELLTSANIQTVYLVMDGKRCPLKAVTNNDRERRRQENLTEARRYKRAGQRDKMYEKYKACIKVRVDLTQAVLAAVAQRFARDGRVKLVWSPYEADAQLVKLCMDGLAQAVITEDSDVLVYSVACEVSFPILFKLDRNTGSCDVISMDWFLSPKNANAQDSNTTVDLSKKASGLEPILSTYISRQLRDPGLGGRLFVQSCVLAGCDYSPNLLTGIGLVTAFKHLRSSIHRTSQERFGNVLKLLPRKARAHLDIVEYEELLAKSEAVFYYHPVCETDGRIVFLQSPNTADTAAVDSGPSHRPNLNRFPGDWSFLGDFSVDGCLAQEMPQPGTAVLAQKMPKPGTAKAAPSASNFFGAKRPRKEQSSAPSLLPTRGGGPVAARVRYNDSGAQAVAKIVAMANPYNMANKRKREDGRKALLPKSPNEPNSKKPNPFAMFARDKENTSKTGLKKFLARDGDDDVRFVKRIFPTDGTRTLIRKAPSPVVAKAPPPPLHCVVDVDVDDKPATEQSEPVSLNDVPEILDSIAGAQTKMAFGHGNNNDDDDSLDSMEMKNLPSRRSSVPELDDTFVSAQQKMTFGYGNNDDDSLDSMKLQNLRSRRAPIPELGDSVVGAQTKMAFDYGNDDDSLDSMKLENLPSRRSSIPELHGSFVGAQTKMAFDYGNHDVDVSRDCMKLKNLHSRRPSVPELDSFVGTQMKMAFGDENDDDCRESTSDRLSAPFGNPSFHSSQKDGNRSKFFGGNHRDYVRRVTEELEEPPEPQATVDTVDGPSLAPSDSNGRQQQFVNLYDDFLSDNSVSDQEEIVESSPETKAPPIAAASSKPIPHRRPNTLVGATKKLRYRLGGKSAPVRKPFSIGQAFQRQQELVVSTRQSATAEPRRGPMFGLKPKKQNTLLSHFSLVVQDDNDNTPVI
jgi:5'-3' exonuclease